MMSPTTKRFHKENNLRITIRNQHNVCNGKEVLKGFDASYDSDSRVGIIFFFPILMAQKSPHMVQPS
jgi:hypothetical protein